ncbi:ankyrin repeat domain-containing protein [Burkholderia cepacia]|uniref:ankyrin repeat domain-containing protein n=1 Tax=Burkholderia cepacia TaxID=292 RepID=UPI0021AB626B|nr:ankyrin repeat domain-containing protein [Burkholderia cepacia]
MFFKRIAIIGSFALTTLTSAVAAADGGALEGRLRSAADRGDAGEVRTLLERGAPIDSRDGQGRTALLLATHGNHVEAARVLIDAGVNVDHVNRLGWTALLEAIMLGDGSERYLPIVQLLVDGHANVDLADSNGETPLRHARRPGRVQRPRDFCSGMPPGSFRRNASASSTQ